MLPTKIVIFEDESLLANDLKQQISVFDFEVTGIFRKAEDGLRYLAEIQDKELLPEIVLMDISLAGKMSGIEAAEIITHKYNIALVFLTGMSQFEIFEDGFKTKHYAFLIKPFNVKQALISIRLAIYQKTLENKLSRSQEDLENKIAERTLELQDAKNSAEEAIRAQNKALATVGLQMREPMLGILGNAALLKRETREFNNLYQFTQYIDDNARQVFSLLNEIMELNDEPKQ